MWKGADEARSANKLHHAPGHDLHEMIFKDSKPTRKVYRPDGARLDYEGAYSQHPDWWNPDTLELEKFGLYLEHVEAP